MKTVENDNKIVKLSQDNSEKRLGVSIDRDALEWEAKRFFGWRSTTKKYNSYSERINALGSVKYDRLIEHLYNLGY